MFVLNNCTVITAVAPLARTRPCTLQKNDQPNLRLDLFPESMLVRYGGQPFRRHMTGLLGGRSDGVVVERSPKATRRRGPRKSVAGTHTHSFNEVVPDRAVTERVRSPHRAVRPPRSFWNIDPRIVKNLGIGPGAWCRINVVWYTQCRPRCAGFRTRTPGADVNHSVVSMFLAVCRCLAALDVKGWPLHTGSMRATLAADVDHAYLSMLLAVNRCLAVFHIEVRSPRA